MNTQTKKKKGRPHKTMKQIKDEKESILRGDLCGRCKKDTVPDDFLKNGKKYTTCIRCREASRKYARKIKDKVNEKRKLTNWGRPKKVKFKLRKTVIDDYSNKILKHMIMNHLDMLEPVAGSSDLYKEEYESLKKVYLSVSPEMIQNYPKLITDK
jgi:hypothetical protein